MHRLFDFLYHLSVIEWALEHVWLVLGSIFTILVSIVGMANRSLPRRDDITISHFENQAMGENTKIWQLFSKFSQNNLPHDLDDSHLNDSKFSGIHALPDGQQAFNARVLLTQLAEQTLDLQYYMWHDDASGRLLFYEVWQAAERGVRVRLLLDDNNTAGMDAVLQTLHDHPNIEVRLFNPFMNRRFRALGYMTALKRLNRRMHNKSFTVDNQVSIFGGRNIGDEYFDANQQMNFADLDVIAIGSVVDDISQDFDRYWNAPASFPLHKVVTRIYKAIDLSKTADEKYQISTESYQESLGKSDFMTQLDLGTLNFEWVKVRFVSDNPNKVLDLHKKGDNLIDQIRDTLMHPKKRLTIVSPYFVPMQHWTQQFIHLAKQGVELNILTNSLTANDVMAVHAGYIRYRKPLLAGKVKIYELKSRLKSLAKDSAKHGKHGGNGKDMPEEMGFWRKVFSLFPSKNPHRTEENPFTATRRQNRKHQHQQNQRNKARWIRNAGSSLHAKTFSVDGERIFVGSFNFDPRSATLNTEMGAIIESRVLASELDATISRWTHELSYTVTMADDKIVWHDHTANPSKEFDDEPESNWRQRLLVWIMGKLPIEEFL